MEIAVYRSKVKNMRRDHVRNMKIRSYLWDALNASECFAWNAYLRMSLAVHQVLWMSKFFIMNVIVIFDNTYLWPCGILCNKYCTEISRPVLVILELSSFYCTMLSDSQWTLTQLHLPPREWNLSANALPLWIGFFGQCKSDDSIWYLFRHFQCSIVR